jgi:hypothetical protein
LRRRPLVEVAGVLALYLVYELTRGLGAGDAGAAYRHALEVAALERRLHVLVEADVQRRAGELPGLLPGLGLFYVFAHLATTVALLVWLYRRRPELYARVRSTLALASFAALGVYAAFPAMPPRLSSADVTDSVTLHTPVNLASSLLGRFYDPYAAVPSMHFGYALLTGIVLARHARGRAVRVAGAAYPGLVLVAIVATGNHYLLDAAAGGGAIALAWPAVRYIDWLTRLRMLPSGSLNQTAFRSPMMWTSPSRVVPGRSS